MKRLAQLATVLLLSSLSFAGTITGKISQANTTIPVAKGTLTFQLSQAAYLSGTFALATDTQYCYTDVLGNVVGVVDPRVAPVVNTNIVSGTLAAGTYYVVYTYKTSLSETYYSAETTINLPSIGSLIISAPTLQPASATGYNVYISSATGTETKQGTVTGWGTFTQSSALISGAALPSVNSTSCTISFNDEMIPSYTSYRVSVSNSAGTAIGGFPQKWRLFGGAAGTINVANGYPTATGDVYFQTPILTTPPSNVRQSINGPLTLNGYAMTAGSLVCTAATGTPCITSTSTTTNAITVNALASSVTVRTTNNVTENWTNPAAIRTFTHPDPGANWNYFYTATAGAMDCTQSWIVCTYTDHLRWNAATCVNTTATTQFSSFATNAASAACNGGSTWQQGVLTFKAAINLEKVAIGNNGAGAGTVVSAAWASNTTAANMIVATVSFVNNAAQTITGVANGGDAFVLAKACANGTAIRSEIWYAMNIAGGTTTAVTATFSAAAVGAIQVHEYSGALTAGALDIAVCSSGSSTDPASGASGALATTPELLIGGLGMAATGISGATATNAGATGHGGTASASAAAIFSSGLIAQAATTTTFTYHLTSSRVYAIALASFKPAVGVAAASVQRPVEQTSDWAGPVNVDHVWYAGPIAGGTLFTPQATTGVVLSSATGCIVTDGTWTGEGGFNTATSTTQAMQAANSNAWITTTNSGLDLTNCTPGTRYMMQMQFSRGRTTVGDTFDGPINVVTYDISHLRNQ